MQPFTRTLAKKSTKLPGIFNKIYGAVFSVFLCQNSNRIPRGIFKKYFFCLPLKDPLGTRLAKTALCFIYSKNLKFYRSYLLFKGQVYKNISRYYDKVIVKPLPLCFTVISLMFLKLLIFIELYYDLWGFIPDLADPGLFSAISQFRICTVIILPKTFKTTRQKIFISILQKINPIYENTLNYSLFRNNLLNNNRN